MLANVITSLSVIYSIADEIIWNHLEPFSKLYFSLCNFSFEMLNLSICTKENNKKIMKPHKLLATRRFFFQILNEKLYKLQYNLDFTCSNKKDFGVVCIYFGFSLNLM